MGKENHAQDGYVQTPMKNGIARTKSIHKRHQCSNCDSSFARKTYLNNHIAVVHEGKKPFKCSICDASLSSKQILERHIKSVHEVMKPSIVQSIFLKCNFCQQMINKFEFAEHVKTSHIENERLDEILEIQNQVSIISLTENNIKTSYDMADRLKGQNAVDEFTPNWILSENEDRSMENVVLHQPVVDFDTNKLHASENLGLEIDKFCCELCDFVTQTKNKIREKQDHLSRVHFKDKIDRIVPKCRPYNCPEIDCSFVGKDYQSMLRHFTGKHDILKKLLKEALSTPDHSERIVDSSDSNQNTADQLKDLNAIDGFAKKLNVCPLIGCTKDFGEMGLLSFHLSTVHKFACFTCLKDFLWHDDLQNHTSQVHENIPLPNFVESLLESNRFESQLEVSTGEPTVPEIMQQDYVANVTDTIQISKESGIFDRLTELNIKIPQDSLVDQNSII